MNGLNTRIVSPDVSVPTHLESLDLDFPMGSYDFSRVGNCCWAVFGPRGGSFGILFGSVNGEIRIWAKHKSCRL